MKSFLGNENRHSNHFVIPPSKLYFIHSKNYFLVVAAGEDNTTVRITLQGIEVIPSFSLNRGEVFQFLAVESSVEFNISGVI